MVQQVQNVFPQVPYDVIQKDLGNCFISQIKTVLVHHERNIYNRSHDFKLYFSTV